MTANRGLFDLYLSGVACIAPGLPDWHNAQAILRNPQSYRPDAVQLPAPNLLPSAERRRANPLVKLVLALSEQIPSIPTIAPRLASVFAASDGDSHNCHALCETLTQDAELLSPTRFHHSVHNVAAGYWSMALGAQGPCQVLSAFDASLSAGIVESAVQIKTESDAVLLIAYDLAAPPPLYAFRPLCAVAGVAFLFEKSPNHDTLARLQIDCRHHARVADSCADPALEALRLSSPPLRALPLLSALAQTQNRCVYLEALPHEDQAQALAVNLFFDR